MLGDVRYLGEMCEVQRLILLLGGEKFGPPSVDDVATVKAGVEVALLEQLAVRLLHMSSWEELLGPTREAWGPLDASAAEVAAADEELPALPKAVPRRRRRKRKA